MASAARLGVLLLILAGTPPATPASPDDAYAKTVQPFLTSHCLKCHGEAKAKGGVRLDKIRPNLAAGEDAPAEEAPSVRFWLSHQQVVAFSKQAETVLTAGRPLCPRCGLPMDPAGHPCPVLNGARPIF